MREATFSIHGYSHAAVIDGDGPSILFVHGSVADYTTFKGLTRRFREAYQCVAYSRRFHPPNRPPGPGDVYDTEGQADEMLTIIGELEASPVVLVGSSFGAYIGLIAALKEPESFRGLVLCEPPMIPLLLHHKDGRPLHEEFLRTVLEPARLSFRNGQDADGLKTFVEGVRGQPGWFDRLFPAMKSDLLRFGPELKLEFLTDHEKYMRDVPPKSLRSLRIPSLLLGGEFSTPMFRAILDVLENSLPQTLRKEIPRAGHLLHLQNPVVFESILRDFLLGL